MPDKIMRAEAQISAKDLTGNAFSSVAGKMKNLAKAARSMEGLPANLGASSRGLAALGRQAGAMKKMAASASAFSSAFVSLPVLGGVGAAAGAAIAVKKITDAGAKMQHERVRMDVAGMSQSEISDATYEAAKLSAKVPNIDRVAIMHMLRNARTIVGSYQEAAEIAEPMLRTRAMVEAAHPGHDLTEEFDKVIKGMELTGVTQDPEKFKSYMQGMAKTLNAFGDTLKPSDYYEMFKLGRQSTQGLSQEYMTTVAPTLAQDIGGPGAGVAQQAFFRAIVAGKMDKGALKAMQEYGLIDPKMIVKNKGGDMASVKPGGILGSDLAMTNPYRWVNDILLPALKAKGVVDPDKIQQVISTLFSKGTAAQLVGIFASQQQRFEKDAAQARGAKGYEAADVFNTKDFSVATKNVVTQLGNLAEEIGMPFSESLTPAISDFAKHLADLNEWMARQNKEKDDGKPTDVDNWWDRVKHTLTAGPQRKGAPSWDEQDIRQRDREIAHLKKAISDREPDSHLGDRRGSYARTSITQMQTRIGELETEIAQIRAKNLSISPFMRSYAQMTPGAPGPKGFAAFPMSAGAGGYAGYGASGAPILPGAKPGAGPAPPFDLKAILTGKIEAKLDGTVPVNVTGNAQVNVKVEAGSELIRIAASARNSTTQMPLRGGSGKPSTGATMPDAGAAK